MSKFKVGDKVRIFDGSKIKNYAGGWIPDMGRYVGEIHEISNVEHLSSDSTNYRLEGVAYVWDERGLERCGNETIVIYRKDNEVVALDKRTGKKAIAKCSPEDTFDFNIGAKLAFDRLMNGNKESITVEDMRKKLKNYCSDMHCEDCKLHSPVCRCGNNTHFMIKDDTGNSKELHKFKVGDIVKGNLKSDGRYNITNSDMTRGKITKVSEDGKSIDVEILEHKRGDDGKFYGLESKYFDLAEEEPKLYNGKIVFTKGDEIFKTGHIYEVKDGRINTAGLFSRVPMVEPFKDIEDVKDYFVGNFDGNRKRKIGWSLCTLELMEVKED